MQTSILQDASRAGVFHVPAAQIQELPRLAIQAQLLLLTADLARIEDSRQILRELGSALGFPTWYGANFDALHDCLTDPAWRPGHGVILLISGLDALRRHDPEAFSTMIEVLRSAAKTRSLGKHPLWILLGSPARGVPSLSAA